MHWQKRFILGCLIGMLIFTSLSRTFLFIYFMHIFFGHWNFLLILIFLSGLLIRSIGLLGKIWILECKLESWTSTGLNASRITGELCLICFLVTFTAYLLVHLNLLNANMFFDWLGLLKFTIRCRNCSNTYWTQLSLKLVSRILFLWFTLYCCLHYAWHANHSIGFHFLALSIVTGYIFL